VPQNWRFHLRYLTFKMLAGRHFGDLLARPLAHFLNKHQLHVKMLGQTTDDGSNNSTMAASLAHTFARLPTPHTFDRANYHLRCAAHKIGNAVKHGMAEMKMPVIGARYKAPLAPTPIIMVNDDDIAAAEQSEAGRHISQDYTSSLDDDDAEDAVHDVEESEILFAGSDVASAVQALIEICRITNANAARRQLWGNCCTEANVEHKELIVLRQIRWNVFYQVLERAVEMQQVSRCLPSGTSSDSCAGHRSHVGSRCYRRAL
jgi:hypothetical protein